MRLQAFPEKATITPTTRTLLGPLIPLLGPLIPLLGWWFSLGEPIHGPRNPKTQLWHIWADNNIYFNPEYKESDSNVKNELIILKNHGISEKSNFCFVDLVINSTGKGHQNDYGQLLAILWWKCIQIIFSMAELFFLLHFGIIKTRFHYFRSPEL